MAKRGGAKIPRICQVCGREFLVYQAQIDAGGAKYCSVACANIGRREAANVDCTCQFCGRVFQCKRCQIRCGHGKYCSRQCFEQSLRDNAMHGGSIERVCEWCGEVFRVRPSAVKPGRARFCSPKCKGANKRFEHNETVCCQQCGKEFTTYNSYRARGGGKFCSAKCQGTWASENLAGPNNPLWMGGYTPYPPGWTRTFRDTIRDRDGYKCMICGVPEGTKKHHCHHINYVKSDLSLSNLILCCPSCHTKTVGNRDAWELKLSQLLHDIYGYEYNFECLAA